MATKEQVTKALATGQNGTLDAQPTVPALMDRDDIRKRFREVLGDKSAGFVTSVISATKANPALLACDPMSVISSAMVAATLDLPVNASLGFAHIVPYKGKAQFQLGWKGFVQLAIRTGQYKTMNTAEVYEGELIRWNRITAEIELDTERRSSDKIVGFVAFFRTLNGFEKYLYMTVDQVDAHAKKYSQSYGYDLRENKKASKWSTDFPAMAMKTVLKLLLSKYGILSVEMQKALRVDQAVIDQQGEPETYPDSIPAENLDQTPAGDAQEV